MALLDPLPEEKVGSLKITQTGANTADVTVTSGTFVGKQVQFITVPPVGAYFNESSAVAEEKKRA